MAASLAMAQHAKRPNIVVIMSDDQDYQLGSLEAQPVVRQELMAKGMTLENHFVTVAQCCPSRTSFLRGQAAHNTNLTHVAPPGYVNSRGLPMSLLTGEITEAHTTSSLLLEKTRTICHTG